MTEAAHRLCYGVLMIMIVVSLAANMTGRFVQQRSILSALHTHDELVRERVVGRMAEMDLELQAIRSRVVALEREALK